MNLFKSSVCAGSLIGLSAAIYNSCVNKTLGAFLFSIGLLTICYLQANLFTGKVGGSNDIKFLAFILLGNICGVGLIRSLWIFNNGNYLILGVFCGMLMQIAVTVYRTMPYVTAMCVGAFILSGFSHSVAMLFTTTDPVGWALCVLGNAIGAKYLYLIGVNSNSI